MHTGGQSGSFEWSLNRSTQLHGIRIRRNYYIFLSWPWSSNSAFIYFRPRPIYFALVLNGATESFPSCRQSCHLRVTIAKQYLYAPRGLTDWSLEWTALSPSVDIFVLRSQSRPRFQRLWSHTSRSHGDRWRIWRQIFRIRRSPTARENVQF
jgi:hypothetical protein